MVFYFVLLLIEIRGEFPEISRKIKTTVLNCFYQYNMETCTNSYEGRSGGILVMRSLHADPFSQKKKREWVYTQAT